ncbi:MAG: indolepyruvate oxidoreductase subunit beta [Acidobacteriota bacterium]
MNKTDILLCGVGGQGVLSVAAIIASAARSAGLRAVQSEVHGMAQRGGAVVAHLRLSDDDIHSATIGLGQADLVISMEPLECLRYVEYLRPGGTLLTSSEPVENIPDYPDLESVLAKVRDLPRGVVVDAVRLAKEAGSARAANVVMVGAALDLLPIGAEDVEAVLEEAFGSKGDKVVRANRDALARGREAGRLQPV